MALAAAAWLGGVSCSPRGMALNSMADAMSASGDTWGSDPDPELIREATPFALKTMESLLAERPEHAGLLLALTRGFTQYAYAFVETDALLLEGTDPERARELTARAVGLYVRARDYGLRALELRRPGVGEALRLSPDSALRGFGVEDVPLLYWLGASWGAAIGAAPGDPELLADFPAVRALITRALALDPEYDRGALHEAMIALESVPELMGGSRARAREHFERALALGGGRKAGPYLSLATGVAVAEQDRVAFESLLNAALAIDADAEPALRVANLVAQRRARHLLAQADDLFYATGLEQDAGPLDAAVAATGESE